LAIVGPDENGYQKKLNSMLGDFESAKEVKGTNCVRLRAGIQFINGLFNKKRWSAYAAADLFIAPSDFENFGQSIAEALCAGIPVITTTGTPWKELKEKGCGWWVEPKPRDVQSALQEAMSLTEAERTEKGQIGRSLIQGFFPQKVAKDMCLLYESVLGNRSYEAVSS
jgi:glycosyltransferase involved in cell wall biosynthesis